MREFLRRVDILHGITPSRNNTARRGADLERKGKGLGPLGLLIAARALAVGAVLVTNDRAFGYVLSLDLRDWTQ